MMAPKKTKRSKRAVVLDPSNPLHADICAQFTAGEEESRAYQDWLRTDAARALDGEPLCVFCGKGQHEVQQLIGGGGSKIGARVLPLVYVCDQCIRLANDIVGDPTPRRRGKKTGAR
jgi:hypothetical protein